MCLYIDKKATNDFKRRTKDNLHKVYIYKKLTLSTVDTFLVSPHLRMKYRYGWNKANKIVIIRGDIYNSIHAYRYKNENYLKCWAYRKDIIGVSSTEIAFSKIFVPKSEYDRVLKLLIDERNKEESRYCY